MLQALDVDGGGDVGGVVLGPGGDVLYEGGEGVGGEEPGDSSHHRSCTHQVTGWHAVVRPVPAIQESISRFGLRKSINQVGL